jgi:hypothetical protein
MKSFIQRRSKNFGSIAAVIAISAFAAACDPARTTSGPATAPSPAAPTSPSPAVSPAAVNSPAPADGTKISPKVEALAGRWDGPEGTYLSISKKGTGYSVEVKNLDGVKTFDGIAKGDTIEFTRNGKTETVKAATGAETGMKGFEKEINCVVITKGSEGFCKKQ